MSKGPTYAQKIAAAITGMKDRKGSSLHAIKASLGANASQFRFINSALKKGVAAGTFSKNGGRYKVVKKAAAPKKKGAKKKKAPKKKKTILLDWCLVLIRVWWIKLTMLKTNTEGFMV